MCVAPGLRRGLNLYHYLPYSLTLNRPGCNRTSALILRQWRGVARNIVNFVPRCVPKCSRNVSERPFSRPDFGLLTAPLWRECGSIGSVALEPIVNQRLYQQVADSIRRQIQSGAMPPGSRLPSEKLLAQQLGVSRPTVREAMIALEIAGLVEIRTGSGSYVRHRDLIAAPSVDTGPGPIELLNARILIEGEIAAEAAQRATPEDLVEIAGTLKEMESIIRAANTAATQTSIFT